VKARLALLAGSFSAWHIGFCPLHTPQLCLYQFRQWWSTSTFPPTEHRSLRHPQTSRYLSFAPASRYQLLQQLLNRVHRIMLEQYPCHRQYHRCNQPGKCDQIFILKCIDNGNTNGYNQG
jgi:hypothetical protein